MVLKTGSRWQDLPRAYGSKTRCHRRLREWQEQGVWERAFRAFLSTAWLGGFRRLLVRWERRAHIYLAFLLMACILILLRVISG